MRSERPAAPPSIGSDGTEAMRKNPEALPAPDRGPAAAASFARLLATIESSSPGPLYRDSSATLLIDGPATYRSMLGSIAGAEHHIHVETFIFADDAVGQRFADALIQKRGHGVAVRVIYDSLGSLRSAGSFFDRMEAAGIELLEFNSVNPADGGNPLNANNRDHRKLLIVDGRVAFTGGLNLSGTYASSSRSRRRMNRLTEGWRDTHVAIHGPAVAGFEAVFQENWRSQGGDFDRSAVASPPPERAGDAVIVALQSEGGDGNESAIYRAYVEAMKVAEDRIWITQAYFAPDKPFVSLLTGAARRGVDVRLIVPGFSDSALVLHASRSRYGELLREGVRIYENTTSLLHAKTAVIDGVWSTVGSSNLDYRSFLHNDEVNAVVFDTGFAGQLEAQFTADLEECQEIGLAEWERRPLGQRLKEFWSSRFDYWL